MTKIRLNKLLASRGIGSRRNVETIIFDGRVKINGEIVLKPEERVDPNIDKIVVDCAPLPKEEIKKYFLLNKPRGYLCSNARPKSYSKIVLDLFPKIQERLYTIGRLDKDSEGLILITNDGSFANQVMHPSSNIEKEYLVKVDVDISHDHLKLIQSGIWFDGRYIKPKKVKKVRKNACKITITEGKKHEVRLFCKKANLKVLSLKRIRLGNLFLGSLAIGSHRFLNEKDKEAIFS